MAVVAAGWNAGRNETATSEAPIMRRAVGCPHAGLQSGAGQTRAAVNGDPRSPRQNPYVLTLNQRRFNVLMHELPQCCCCICLIK